MNRIIEKLKNHPRVSDYRINLDRKESCELFFVHGRLETLRRTDTLDTEVTVYCAHGDFLGDAQFLVYPSTTDAQLDALIDEAAGKALLIDNPKYDLPENETGDFAVESNFALETPENLAEKIAACVFIAQKDEKASLNAVEIFVDRYEDTVLNSRGVRKTQRRFGAMVEAIPTYTDGQSVELYEQYHFAQFDETAIMAEIAEKMREVKARFEAKKPENPIFGKVVLNKLELHELFWTIAGGLDFAAVYAKANRFHKGEAIQTAPKYDALGITLRGEMTGSVAGTKFDRDGMALCDTKVIAGGVVQAYFGAGRFAQYLGEKPTGALPCLSVAPGSAQEEALCAAPYLNVLSMSGLQVDPFGDYIGGEVRLAFYFDGEKTVPVTGISFAGKLSDALNSLRLSEKTCTHGSYHGPAFAVLEEMKIF